MAFTDPQSITVNAVAKSLVRIREDNGTSVYWLRESLGEYVLTIKQSSFQKNGQTIDRHSVDVVQTIYATSTVPEITRHAYTVVENSRLDTVADPVYLAAAMATWMTASTNANLLKLVNRET